MSSDNQSITKCHYRYSQINNFVSVKDFMFVKENGYNHLLIRFCNFSDYEINSIAFTIIQLDASGKVLGNLKCRDDNINMLPGNTYAPAVGFKVSEDCCDCKIIIRSAESGNFVYRVRQNKVLTYYRKPTEEIVDGGNDTKRKPLFYVKSSRTKKPRASVFLCSLCLVFIMVLNIARPIALYYEQEVKDYFNHFAENIWKAETDSADIGESSK